MTVIVDHKVPAATSASNSPLKNQSLFERWLIMPKLLYFMLSCVIYGFHNFGTKYFIDEWGLKLYEVGYVSAFGGFSFLGAIFWTNLADRTSKHKIILIVTTIGYCLILSLLNLKPFPKENGLLRFAYTSSVFAIANIFQSGIFPLLDAAVLGILMKNPRFSKDLFGYQRIAGSFSHSFVNALSGFLLHTYGFLSVFAFVALSGAIFVFCIIVGIPHDAVSGNPAGSGHGHHGHHGASGHGANKTEEIREIKSWRDYPSIRLLTNFSFLFFMLFILTTGIVRVVMTNYQAQFIMDKVKFGTIMAGIVAASRLISEVLVYLVGKKLIAIFGVYWILMFAQITGILRLFGYAMLGYALEGYDKAPVSLQAASFGLELLKGLNSGLIVSSAIRIASDTAPRGCESTAQGLFSGNYNGLSNAVGGLLAGYLLYIQDEGTNQLRTMFLWVSMGSAAVTFLLGLKYALIDRVLGCSAKSRHA